MRSALSRWTADRRVVAAVVVATVVLGFSLAAAVDALARPEVAVADGYGPGDGLSRWVLATDGDPAALVAAAAAAPGVVDAQALRGGGVLVATGSADPTGLAAIPGVTSVEASVSVPVMSAPTDPYWSGYGWNLENTGSNAYSQTAVADADVDATAGWAASTGTGIVVALTDTGFDSDHPDLVGSLWTNPDEPCGSTDTDGNGLAGDCHGWNFTTSSADVDNGANGTHGTSVAGAAGARAGNAEGSAGVAPDITLMPLVIGSGSSVDVNLGIQAIYYAVDHGASVINASWGGSFTGSALTGLQTAVAYAGSHGVLVVAAAGNDSGNRDTTPVYPASLTDDALVTVGSSTAADTLSSSSAYGATSVDLMAPGNLVFTTWNDGGYRLVSGTSIAAPEVAAVLAQYRSLMPSATALELKQALLADVDPIPAFASRSVSGGRLTTDGLAALGTQQVRWTYSGMTGAPGALSPGLTTSSTLPTGTYTAVLGLGMRVSGRTWAVSGQAVTVGGTTYTTDDTGTVSVPLGARGPSSATLVVAPGTTLTAGSYVLTVQLLQDGVALGRPSAAPLLVGVSTTAPTTSGSASPTTTAATTTSASGPTSSAGGGAGSSSSAGTSSASTTAATTTSSGAGSTSAGSTGGSTTSAAGSSSAGSTSSASSSSPAGTGTSASNTASTTAGTTTSAPTTSVAAPTTTASTTTGSGPTSTTTAATGTSTSTAGTTTASTTTAVPTVPPGGSTVYPGVGDFRVTSLSPTTVDVAGGAPVRVVGTFPAQPRVLVGSSGLATIVSWSPTQVVFTAPARVAGSYDVLLSTTSGMQSLLPGALTYTSATASPTTAASSSATGSSSSATATSSSGSTSAPTSAAPEVTTGPGGQRLVGTSFFAAMPASVWAVSCSSSCSGTLV